MCLGGVGVRVWNSHRYGSLTHLLKEWARQTLLLTKQVSEQQVTFLSRHLTSFLASFTVA